MSRFSSREKWKRAGSWSLSAFLLSIVITVSALHLAQPTPVSANERPAEWASKVETPPLQNFYCLSSNLYRGAQPSKEGMAALQKMGVKTVINLRGFHSDKGKLGKLELHPERIRFNTWHATDEEVVAFLKIATDTNRFPVFVHCMHGSDRTGMMCAMYRITVCGWTREEAIREMTTGGYGFHPEWQNLLRYIRNVDIDKIKKAAGIADAAKPS